MGLDIGERLFNVHGPVDLRHHNDDLALPASQPLRPLVEQPMRANTLHIADFLNRNVRAVFYSFGNHLFNAHFHLLFEF